MAKTIIQTIGPLYGEVENGTVFGRPNGSVYVPPTNKISLTTPAYAKVTATAVAGSDSAGNTGIRTYIVAEAQDIASSCLVEVSLTSDFAVVIAKGGPWSAGQFNIGTTTYGIGTNLLDSISDGDTLYVRAVLISQTNVPVATSEVTEVRAVVA